MTASARLRAIGYDNTAQADTVRDEITRLGWGPGRGGKYLILDDIVVVVRHLDGSFALDRKPFRGVANVVACAGVGR